MTTFEDCTHRFLNRRIMADQKNNGGNNLKRRVLGKNKKRGSSQGQSGNKDEGRRNKNKNRNRNNKSASNRSRNNDSKSKGNQNSNRPSGGNNQGNRQRSRRRNRNRKPAPPKAFFQRDILLIPRAESVKVLNEIRAKYDPLATKVPPHVTLVFPRPKNELNEELLSNWNKESLPDLSEVLFNQIIVHDEMYLWLVPDEEGAEKLKAWYGSLQSTFKKDEPPQEEDTEVESTEASAIAQGQYEHDPEVIPASLGPDKPKPDLDGDFKPHITLGYVPRSKTEEEVILQAKETITLPILISFEKLMVEEFDENQLSVPVKTIPVQEANSAPPTN